VSPRQFSRHTFCRGITDDAGRQLLTAPEPFRFMVLPDNASHIVAEGDTLWTLADRYYHPHPQAAQLWWVIADFQPQPIVDPTVRLAPGTVLLVPSLRTVLERVFNERRRDVVGA